MTRIEADQILALFRNPGWGALMKQEEDKLDKLHRDLEWAVDEKALRIQGQIIEIRGLLGLQNKLSAYVKEL
jgi:hypothetical protein